MPTILEYVFFLKHKMYETKLARQKMENHSENMMRDTLQEENSSESKLKYGEHNYIVKLNYYLSMFL